MSKYFTPKPRKNKNDAKPNPITPGEHDVSNASTFHSIEESPTSVLSDSLSNLRISENDRIPTDPTLHSFSERSEEIGTLNSTLQQQEPINQSFSDNSSNPNHSLYSNHKSHKSRSRSPILRPKTTNHSVSVNMADNGNSLLLHSAIKDAFSIDTERITKFSGDGGISFKSWIDSLELLFRADDINNDRRKVILPALLSGRALQVYRSIPPAVQADYDQLKAELTRQLESTELKQRHRESMHNCKLDDFNTVSSYAAHLYKLADIAYSGANEQDIKNQALLDSFIRGLSTNLRKAIKPLAPRTYIEALDKCLLLENDPDFRSKSVNFNDPYIEPCTSTARSMSPKSSTIDSLLQTISKMSISQNNQNNDRPNRPYRSFRQNNRLNQGPRFTRQNFGSNNFNPNNFRFTNNRFPNTARNQNVRCYTCNRPGHVSSNCRFNNQQHNTNPFLQNRNNMNQGRQVPINQNNTFNRPSFNQQPRNNFQPNPIGVPNGPNSTFGTTTPRVNLVTETSDAEQYNQAVQDAHQMLENAKVSQW